MFGDDKLFVRERIVCYYHYFSLRRPTEGQKPLLLYSRYFSRSCAVEHQLCFSRLLNLGLAGCRLPPLGIVVVLTQSSLNVWKTCTVQFFFRLAAFRVTSTGFCNINNINIHNIHNTFYNLI